MLPNVRKPVDPAAIQSDLKVLAEKSKVLNRLTDDLAKYIDQIESVINALNVGLSVSVTVERSGAADSPFVHIVRLLYSKNDGKWGLAIDEFDEDETEPDADWRGHKSWAFKDAPRALRLKVVHRIPDLIKALVKESERMTDETAATVTQAVEIVSSLSKKALTGPGIDLSKSAPAGTEK